jgi:hypothetical protein
MKVANIDLASMCAPVSAAEITIEVSTLTQRVFFAQLCELTVEGFLPIPSMAATATCTDTWI